MYAFHRLNNTDFIFTFSTDLLKTLVKFATSGEGEFLEHLR